MRLSRPGLITLGFVVLLLGAAALLRALSTVRRVRRTRWIRTNGRLRRAATRCNAEGGPYLDLSYEYEVAGRTYRSGQIAADGRDGLSDLADLEIVDRYQVGDSIAVFVHESDPSIACLRPTQLREVPVLLVAGVVFVAVGLYLVWLAAWNA